MIFNAEMVRALLAGRKTQTRRIIKNQREGDSWSVKPAIEPRCSGHTHDWWLPNATRPYSALPRCPYGVVNDRIWVRETFAGHYLDDAQIQDIKDDRDKATDLCEYRADYPDGYQAADGWTPSIHMPRWASRITLEITGVRVERLQDISQEDAKAEGMELTGWRPTYSDPDSGGEVSTPYDNFAILWETLYGEESWLANPWVWVVEFKRVEGDRNNG